MMMKIQLSHEWPYVKVVEVDGVPVTSFEDAGYTTDTSIFPTTTPIDKGDK